MVRSLTQIFGSVCFMVAAHGGLQLTPKLSEYEGDGARFKHFEFSDGGKTVTYQPPRGWEYSGSPSQLMLRPPNRSQAEATITRIALLLPGGFDEESLKSLVSDAVAQIPKGSENVTIVSQEKNKLLIEHKETFLITLSYTFYGQKFARSILFVNRRNEQIRAQLTCREADFIDLHPAFLRSQSTWQHL